jgi:hypothetical protein
VDSGAADCTTPQTIGKAFGSEPIEASKTGNCYSVANGMPIGNCCQKGAKGVLGSYVDDRITIDAV